MNGSFIVCVGDDEVVVFEEVDPHLAWCFGQYVSLSGGFRSEFGVAGDDEVGGRGLCCHDVADPAPACNRGLYRAIEAKHVPSVFPLVVTGPELADVAVSALLPIPAGL